MRRSFWIIFLTMFIDLLGFGLIIPILPVYSQSLGASGTMIGIIAGSYSLMQFLFAPIWGSLSDRYGRKPILMSSIALTVFAYIFFANADTLLLLLLSRSFSGIGSANISVAQAYISDISTPKNRARSFGLIGVAFGLGFILGPPIGGALKEFFGIEALGYGAALLALINFTFVWLFLEESFVAEKRASKTSFTNPFATLYHSLSNSKLQTLLLLTFLYISAFSMMHVTASLLWENEYAQSEAQIGYIFAFIGLSVVIVQGLFVGPATSRFGEKNLLVSGCLLMALGLLLIPYVPKVNFYLFLSIPLILLAFGNGFASPSIQSILSQSAPVSEQGKIMGVYQSVGSLGRVAGPILGATMFDVKYFAPYIIASLIMMLCFAMAARLLRSISL